MTVTDKVLAANRANARKSTGPRTKRGKDRARMNALRHGFFAQGLLLTGEDADELHSFRERMLKTLSPRDAIELMLCERVVSGSWRLRRLQTIESVTHHTAATLRLNESFPTEEGALDVTESENPGEQSAEPARERFGFNKPVSDRERRRRQALVDQAMNMPGVGSIAIGLAHGDDLMERLSRYEQRLDMLIHRSLRQLEKHRKRTRSPRNDESAQPSSRPTDTRRATTRKTEKRTSIVRNEPACPRAIACDHPVMSRSR
jgi:hypothetical protein